MLDKAILGNASVYRALAVSGVFSIFAAQSMWNDPAETQRYLEESGYRDVVVDNVWLMPIGDKDCLTLFGHKFRGVNASGERGSGRVCTPALFGNSKVLFYREP